MTVIRQPTSGRPSPALDRRLSVAPMMDWTKSRA